MTFLDGSDSDASSEFELIDERTPTTPSMASSRRAPPSEASSQRSPPSLAAPSRRQPLPDSSAPPLPPTDAFDELIARNLNQMSPTSASAAGGGGTAGEEEKRSSGLADSDSWTDLSLNRSDSDTSASSYELVESNLDVHASPSSNSRQTSTNTSAAPPHNEQVTAPAPQPEGGPPSGSSARAPPVEALLTSHGLSGALAPAVYQFMENPPAADQTVDRDVPDYQEPSPADGDLEQHLADSALLPPPDFSDTESQVSELSVLPAPLSPASKPFHEAYAPAQPAPAQPFAPSELLLGGTSVDNGDVGACQDRHSPAFEEATRADDARGADDARRVDDAGTDDAQATQTGISSCAESEHELSDDDSSSDENEGNHAMLRRVSKTSRVRKNSKGSPLHTALRSAPTSHSHSHSHAPGAHPILLLCNSESDSDSSVDMGALPGAAHKRLIHPAPRHVLFESDTDGAFPAARRNSAGTASKMTKAPIAPLMNKPHPILEEPEFGEEAEASAGYPQTDASTAYPGTDATDGSDRERSDSDESDNEGDVAAPPAAAAAADASASGEVPASASAAVNEVPAAGGDAEAEGSHAPSGNVAGAGGDEAKYQNEGPPAQEHFEHNQGHAGRRQQPPPRGSPLVNVVLQMDWWTSPVKALVDHVLKRLGISRTTLWASVLMAVVALLAPVAMMGGRGADPAPSPPEVVPRAPPYSHIGCFAETNPQAFPNKLWLASTSNIHMTADRCYSRCAARNATHFALSRGSMCACGDETAGARDKTAYDFLAVGDYSQGPKHNVHFRTESGDTLTLPVPFYARYGPSFECLTPCEGAPHTMCGGEWANSVFSIDSATKVQHPLIEARLATEFVSVLAQMEVANALRSPEQQGPEYMHEGCYAYDHLNFIRNKRAEFVRYNMTVRECAKRCSPSSHFLLQGGWSCRCADEKFTLPEGQQSDSSRCNMPCPGNPLRKCGGREHVDVYRRVGKKVDEPEEDVPHRSYTRLGCYRDTHSRALTGVVTQSTELTIEKCAAACDAVSNAASDDPSDKMYDFFGLQYGSQCFCGKARDKYGQYGATDRCDYRCAGDQSQYCGGKWANAVYAFDKRAPSDATRSSPSPRGSAHEANVEQTLEALHTMMQHIESRLSQIEMNQHHYYDDDTDDEDDDDHPRGDHSHGRFHRRKRGRGRGGPISGFLHSLWECVCDTYSEVASFSRQLYKNLFHHKNGGLFAWSSGKHSRRTSTSWMESGEELAERVSDVLWDVYYWIDCQAHRVIGGNNPDHRPPAHCVQEASASASARSHARGGRRHGRSH